MTRAQLICCEKTGRWAVALRREVANLSGRVRDAAAGVLRPAARPTRVCETRSLADCWEALAAAPASWLLLETTEANVEQLATRLMELGRGFPEARAIICGERAIEGCQWLLREAGAVHAVFSPRELAPVARMAARHLAQAQQPQLTLRERVWESLPW